MKIGFFGTPQLSASVLEDLFGAPDVEVAFVVTNPDKPVGRSGELKSTPVKSLAILHGVPVLTPIKIRDNTEFLEAIREHSCDYFIVVAYGRILPKILLELPKKKCINVHGSILPKYRGASPIQSALLFGEKETGVTIMEMSEGMDEGDILWIHTIPIEERETSETLFTKFAEVSGPVLLETLSLLERGEIKATVQNPTLATYCTKIEKEDGIIDWNESAETIYHKWQAYTPWPGISTTFENKRLLLEEVGMRVIHQENHEIGSVVRLESGEIGVTCGKGILTLSQVKLEGKKSQGIRDFINGKPSFISSRL